MYKKSINQIFNELNSSIYGLTENEAKKRLKKFGKNMMQEKKQDSIFIIFIKQFADILVIILLISAFISKITGENESAFVILAVIIINALLGTIQIVNAQKSLNGLKSLTSIQVKVKRENEIKVIDASDLTIGDIVLIEAGDIISGDGRLIEASSLQVNESTLTGESLSVDKISDVINEETILANRKNMVYSGSLVTHGNGIYIVTHIGMNTEIGKIAGYLNDVKDKKTPLQKDLDHFSIYLSIGIIGICFIVMFLNIFLAHQKLLEAFMIAVALAVAAIPEALTSIVMIVLSTSTKKMVKENAIIKTLASVETLGCVSVICSDKTGTLTQNRMTGKHVFINNQRLSHLNIKNHDHFVLVKNCYLCNNAVFDKRIGDPVELALLDFVKDFHINNTRINELPFDSSRKIMSINTSKHIYSKGAFDELIKRCDYILLNGRKEKLTKRQIDILKNENEKGAKEGLRILGFAYKNFLNKEINNDDENHLTFIGLIAMIDPPRTESYSAVKKCKGAGIKPIMITGDHIVTAQSIAKEVGIYEEGDLCIEGEQLEKMNDKQLDELLPMISVYARVSPHHKLRIVKSWQKRKQVVAMTGDGVNDAPALKQSDIGIAMGLSGTEVSKDAADMILIDDHFSTIIKAIETGRNVYNNIKNAILYLLSGNLAGIICVLLSSLLILPTPFYAVHLLFINLITDSLPAIAIGFEAENSDILKQKPRKTNEPILNKEALLQILYEGIIIGICTMCSYFMGLRHDALSASTMAFSTMCLARLLHGFNCRSQKSLFEIGIFTNHYTILAFITGFICIHTVLFANVFQKMFSIHPLTFIQFLCVYAFALIPTLIIQLRKNSNVI